MIKKRRGGKVDDYRERGGRQPMRERPDINVMSWSAADVLGPCCYGDGDLSSESLSPRGFAPPLTPDWWS